MEKDNIAKSYLESVKGIIAVFSVVILCTVSATCVQLLGRRIPDLELNTFRCGIPLIFYSIGLIMMQRWPRIDRSEIGATLLYSLAGSSCKLGEFVAVTFLPASAVSCFFFYIFYHLWLVFVCTLTEGDSHSKEDTVCYNVRLWESYWLSSHGWNQEHMTIS